MMSDLFPNAIFGTPSDDDEDEDEVLEDTDSDFGDDDEELPETPPDVVAQLGFDPAKEED